MHAAPRGYGNGGHVWAETVRGLAEQYDCWSVLDYGCGRGTLAPALRSDQLADARVSSDWGTCSIWSGTSTLSTWRSWSLTDEPCERL